MPKEVAEQIPFLFKEIKRDMTPEQICEIGKKPALLIDVQKILSALPPTVNEYSALCASILFGISTGARVSSVVGIELQDITRVLAFKPDEFEDMWHVTVNLRVRKNMKSVTHEIILEGRSKEDSDFSDAVYWLGKHIKEKFDIDIFNRHFRIPRELESNRLFPWKPNTLSNRFQDISEKAGYPDK
jgi:hypothetical protein